MTRSIYPDDLSPERIRESQWLDLGERLVNAMRSLRDLIEQEGDDIDRLDAKRHALSRAWIAWDEIGWHSDHSSFTLLTERVRQMRSNTTNAGEAQGYSLALDYLRSY